MWLLPERPDAPCDSVRPPSGQVSVGDRTAIASNVSGSGATFVKLPITQMPCETVFWPAVCPPLPPAPSKMSMSGRSKIRNEYVVGPSLVHVVFLDGLDRFSLAPDQEWCR